MIKLAYAASSYSPPAGGIIRKINAEIINPLIGLLIALAVIMFLWGVVEFIANSDNEEKREDGKKHIIWGIVGIFIMVSVFGIMNLICGAVGC